MKKHIYKIGVYCMSLVLLCISLPSYAQMEDVSQVNSKPKVQYIANRDGTVSIIDGDKVIRYREKNLSKPNLTLESEQQDRHEIVEKRDAYSKHYLNSDGTITATIGNTPIHYKYGDSYEEIDVSIKSRAQDKKARLKSLENTNALESEAYNQLLLEGIADNDEFEYASEKNTFKAYFNSAYDLNGGRLAKFALKNSEGKIRYIVYSLEDAKPTSETVKNNKITYRDIYDNVDLEYIMDFAKLKENIVVKAPVDTFEYAFTLDTEGTRATMTEQGGIDFIDIDTQEKLWEIQPPVAFDSSDKQHVTYNLEYILQNDSKDSSRSKVILRLQDNVFLENATYPIIIDPSTTKNRTHGRYICEAGWAYNDTYDSNTGAYVGYPWGTNDDEVRMYLNFDISSVPIDSIVTDAKLKINPSYAFSHNESGYFAVNRLTSSFTNATWDNKPSFTTSNQSKIYTTDDDTKQWTLTNMMQDIFSNNYTFYGLEVKADPANACSWGYTLDNLPTLSITYAVNHTPALTITSPSNGALYSESHTSISPLVEVSDADNNALTCKVFIDSESSPRSTTTITSTSSTKSVTLPALNMGSLSEGNHQLKVTLYDGYETVTKTLSFKVDKSAPTITSHSITALSNQLNMQISATDAIAGLHTYPYRYTVDGQTSVWTSSNTYNKIGLNPGIIYDTKMEVRDALGHVSEYVEAKCTKPEAPTLSISSATSSTLHLTINDNNPTTTVYEISAGDKLVGTDGYLFTGSGVSIPLPSKQITVKGLTANNSYTFRIRACREGEWSDYSDEVIGTTSSGPPSTPSNITTEAVSNEIMITWNSVSHVTGYELKLVDEDAKELIIDVGNQLTYTHRKLNPETTYTYYVRAKNSVGYSPWSNATQETTTTNIYRLNGEIGETYDILIKAFHNNNLEDNVYTITYDEEALEVEDLYLMSWVKEKAIGEQPGTISFVIARPIESVKQWTGLLNGVRFKSKINGTTDITITVQ